MLLLGLLLLAATAAFVGLLIADNLSGGPDYSVSVFGNHVATMNSLSIFLAGLALALFFGLSLALIVAGLTRAHHRRLDRRLAARSAQAQPPPHSGSDAMAEPPAESTAKHSKRHRFRFSH
ncbi:hypothetical protein ACFU7T_04090 [Streptomyces sp. NPDC057555]|uniref:hypothetical protein n=1 Tax=Streptomyces sp. NPDC057555 TaxID=3346166 RepID=UPI00368B6990